MNVSRSFGVVVLAGTALAGGGCTSRAADESRAEGRVILDDARQGAGGAVSASKKAGAEALDAGKDVALAAGEVVTDSWVTAKLKAKFADERVLAGSDVTVETTHLTVTLTGHVPSGTAKSRAEAIASGTEGVVRVVNQLVVRN